MNSREAFEKEFPTPSNVVFNGKYVPRYAFDKTENASIHQWMWLSWQASRKQLLKELSEKQPDLVVHETDSSSEKVTSYIIRPTEEE